MKLRLIVCLVVPFLISGICFSQIQEPRGCANVEAYRHSKMAPFSAGGAVFEEWFSKLEKSEFNRSAVNEDEIYTIPVVVHVLHNGEAIGVGKNLSDERVKGQIDILNNDYGKKEGTPGFNINPVGVDTRIRFCLASLDPNGLPTNGIVRINTQVDGFDFNPYNTTLKNTSLWNPDKYLNIWTVKFLVGNHIGYAQYPFIQPAWADSLNFPQPVPDVQPDGVVIEYRVFGNVPSGESGPFRSYNTGRTVTHEIGHYLGLLHIWGDGNGCSDPNATDYCEDTPKQNTFTAGCPNSVASCTTGIAAMKEDYMDYTNDVCMNIFTANQKKRMRIVMRNCIRRKSILQNPVPCGYTTDTQYSKPNIPVIKDVKLYFKNNDIASGVLVVEAPDGLLIERIVLFDGLGKEFKVRIEKNTTDFLIDVRSLAQGIYLAKIETSNGAVKNIRFRKL